MSALATISAIDETDAKVEESHLSITRIKIEKLFGRYTYDLYKEEDTKGSLSSLFILYGDNGSGKTTILKLLFHLLSPDNKRGHRFFITQTPFYKLSVSLADGTDIEVVREEKNLPRSLQIELIKKGISLSKVEYKINENGKIEGSDGGELLKKLSELQLNVFFLGHDRVLNSDLFESEEPEAEHFMFMTENRRVDIDSRRFVRTSSSVPNVDRDFALKTLKTSIARTEAWIQEQLFKGSNRGSANVHNVYEDVISRIISDESVSKEFPHSQQQLIEELKAQQDRSKEFSHFGLMASLDTQNLINTISNSNEATLPITWSVLKPYLDSVSARLNALQDTKNLLKLFVDTVNSFFNDKKIDLHAITGLKIKTESGQEILPDSLSSGEKQLLLLLCNTLTARDKATIFMIDEPEISLNIKWQRQLIRALLDLTKGSSVQFLLATHSIELLAQYNRNVVSLKDFSKEIENGR